MNAGREMDALVAEKVMGIKVNYAPAERYEVDGVEREAPQQWWVSGGVLPPYSKDMNAAWLVVERMNTSDYQAMAKFHWYLEDEDDGRRRIQFLDAATAAALICRAALLAVEVPS